MSLNLHSAEGAAVSYDAIISFIASTNGATHCFITIVYKVYESAKVFQNYLFKIVILKILHTFNNIICMQH